MGSAILDMFIGAKICGFVMLSDDIVFCNKKQQHDVVNFYVHAFMLTAKIIDINKHLYSYCFFFKNQL